MLRCFKIDAPSAKEAQNRLKEFISLYRVKFTESNSLSAVEDTGRAVRYL